MSHVNEARSWPAVGWLIVVLFCSSGCGSKELEDLKAKAQQSLDQAKQSVGEAKKTVEETAKQLPGSVAAVTAGDIKLVLDAPLNSATCSARFTPPANGRRGLLQIGTSVSSGPQSFPAVYLHAPTDAASLAALQGQTVPGQLFVAMSESEGHYQSADGKPVSVQIIKVENNVVTCQLQNGEVTCLDQPQLRTVPISGTLVGAVRP